ncbi:MAG: serine hydrolase [Jatrophihabitantaceae bacterium]
MVAIAAVISVVLLTLTAWGHRRTAAGQTGADPVISRPVGSSASVASTSPSLSQPVSSSTPPPARTATAPPGKPRVTARQLTTNLARVFGPGDSFSVAGYDLSTGRGIAAGAISGMTEASLVKLDILETALYRQQGGGYLDDDDVQAMIEHSDNAAADRVFVNSGGNGGLQRYNDTVGLSRTVLDPTGTWGLSTTAATDQLVLLKQLVSSRSPLNAASRAYALQLMDAVEDDQNWGISAAADNGTESQLKNGWLNIDRDNGLWAVNSAGVAVSGGHKLLLVVLSQHQPDYRTGVSRVEAAARQLAAALRT